MALRGGYTDAQDALGHTAHGSRCPVPARDRKSTRLNSSHDQISYAVFCLKKKKKKKKTVRLKTEQIKRGNRQRPHSRGAGSPVHTTQCAAEPATDDTTTSTHVGHNSEVGD